MKFKVTKNETSYWIERTRDGECLWLDGDDIVTIAKDKDDYMYTHGGFIYRHVCEATWEAIANQ